MFIHVNLQMVVIDVTEDLNYVGINETTGKKVIVREKAKALGVLGSEVIHPLVNRNLTEDYYNVLDVIPCDIIPEDYAPGKYIYNDGTFTENTDTVPDTNESLTVRLNTSELDILDTRGGLIETSEALEESTLDIEGLREAILELNERVEELEG